LLKNSFLTTLQLGFTSSKATPLGAEGIFITIRSAYCPLESILRCIDKSLDALTVLGSASYLTNTVGEELLAWTRGTVKIMINYKNY